MAAFPGQSVFTTLPSTLDRQQIRVTCAKAGESEDAATNAFLATMAWGYGNVAYGPWRVAQALEDCHAGRKLFEVVKTLTNDGPQAAYRLMAGPSRLDRIGPAFGTKFLYFVDPALHDRRALIFDRLVADWLGQNVAFRMNPVSWAPARYDEYLEQMHQWAAALQVESDAVELAIFQEMSERLRNQWAKTGR